MRCSRTKAPSLHRRYPASPVLQASPPPSPAQPDPRGLSVGACHATGRASRVCVHPPSSTRATATTPAEPLGARVARFPTGDSLPRCSGGSASALPVSRPARRSLALQPVWSLNRPRRPFVLGVLQPMSLPPSSAPTATGWSDSCRAGFAPAEGWRLSRQTELDQVAFDRAFDGQGALAVVHVDLAAQRRSVLLEGDDPGLLAGLRVRDRAARRRSRWTAHEGRRRRGRRQAREPGIPG